MIQDKKNCIKCGALKPLTDFNKSKVSRGGLSTKCKACISEWHRENYLKNRDKILATNGRYREANIDKLRESSRERARCSYAANPERYRQRAREYVARNLGKTREYARLYAAKRRAEGRMDKEKNREYQAAYRERNRDAINERHKLHVEGKQGSHSPAHGERQGAAQNGRRQSDDARVESYPFVLRKFLRDMQNIRQRLADDDGSLYPPRSRRNEQVG